MIINDENNLEIILCIYKDYMGLENTIESVLNQSYKFFKLILIDDGSNCKIIKEILNKYHLIDKRVVAKLNIQNNGLTKCLFDQVNNSKSKYIGRIDSGDIWLPMKLEKQMQLLDKFNDIFVIGTQCVYVNEFGESVGYSNFGLTDSLIRKNILLRNGIFEHSSIIFKNQINYRQEFIYSQDLDLYLRSSRLGKLFCINEYLTISQIKINGITVSKKYLQRKYQNLAYKCFYKDTNNFGKHESLKIKEYFYEKNLWSFAKIFWIYYVKSRLYSKNLFLWLPPFLLSLLFFPPLLKDYILRIYLNLKFKYCKKI